MEVDFEDGSWMEVTQLVGIVLRGFWCPFDSDAYLNNI
jgi:hypothetical protein